MSKHVACTHTRATFLPTDIGGAIVVLGVKGTEGKNERVECEARGLIGV